MSKEILQFIVQYCLHNNCALLAYHIGHPFFDTGYIRVLSQGVESMYGIKYGTSNSFPYGYRAYRIGEGSGLYKRVKESPVDVVNTMVIFNEVEKLKFELITDD